MEDPEVAWIDGEVAEVNGEELKIICPSGKTVSVCLIYPTLNTCKEVVGVDCSAWKVPFLWLSLFMINFGCLI